MIVSSNRSTAIKLLQYIDDTWQSVEPDDENMIRFDSGQKP
jgi:hypothetical protein